MTVRLGLADATRRVFDFGGDEVKTLDLSGQAPPNGALLLGRYAVDELAPERAQVFALARENHPVVGEPDLIYPVTRAHILDQVALQPQASVDEITTSLYADLADNHVLDVFDTPTPDWLLNRYNVALAQAMFYRCARMRLSVHRNLPVRYK